MSATSRTAPLTDIMEMSNDQLTAFGHALAATMLGDHSYQYGIVLSGALLVLRLAAEVVEQDRPGQLQPAVQRLIADRLADTPP